MRIFFSRSSCLATLVICTALLSTTGCKAPTWGSGSTWSAPKVPAPSWPSWMSWKKPWGGSSTANLAAAKPSTSVPTPSSSVSPSGASIASGNPSTNHWSSTPTATTGVAATYPTTGQAYSYPTQPAAAYQANSAAPGVAPTSGYQTGPYGMTSQPAAAAAPAAGGYAGSYGPSTAATGQQAWNTNTQPTASPNYAPQGYAAPASNYQTADQRSAVAPEAGSAAPGYGANPYGQPAAPANRYESPAPAAGGYPNSYPPAATEPAPYGGSPYNNQGAATDPNSYQQPGGYQPEAQAMPDSSYAAAPQAAASPYSQPSTPVATTAPASHPVLPAGLAVEQGGYRPGSTGRSDAQNARYDSTGTGGYNAAPAYSPTDNQPAYGNTYTR